MAHARCWPWRSRSPRRLACHFLSGLIFFAEYAPAWEVGLALRPHLQPACTSCPRHPHRAAAAGRCSRPTTRRFPAGDGRRRDGRRHACHAAPALAAVFLDGDYEDDEYYTALARSRRPRRRRRRRRRVPAARRLRPDSWWATSTRWPATDLERLAAAGVEVVRHPVRKDVTDGELAVDEALRRGRRRGRARRRPRRARPHPRSPGDPAPARGGRRGRPAAPAPGLTVLVMAAPARSCSRRRAGHTRLARAGVGGAPRSRSPGWSTRWITASCRRRAASASATPSRHRPAVIELHEGVVVVLVEDGAAAVSAAAA